MATEDSTDYDSALWEQQAILLNRIDALTRNATIDNPSEKESLYKLKLDYNKLVKKRAKLATSPLLDPMEGLPPELLPDIFSDVVDGTQYPINELLNLTSVSKGWCSMLTGLSVLWTQIRLDHCEPDYLAKAALGIQLSGGCEIDLLITNLTPDEWREISSLIVPEGRRIRGLLVKSPEIDYVLTRQVLDDFPMLPVLGDMLLSIWPNTLAEQHFHASLKEKMPSIRILTTLGGNLEGEMWNPYTTSCFLSAGLVTKEHLETWALAPQLRYLTFSETDRTLEDMPKRLKSSFGSVTNFTYDGPDVCRRLTWIGNNLSSLSTAYAGDGDLNPLLAAISCFNHLRELEINISNYSWDPSAPNKNDSISAAPKNSVKFLRLVADPENEDEQRWEVFLASFLLTSPGLEVLNLQGGFITDLSWNCVQSIAKLRELNISSIFGDFPLPLNIKSLRNIRWSGSVQSLAQVLPRLQSKFVKILRLHDYGVEFITPTIVAGSAFPNITSLVISTTGPAMWELSTLLTLRELKVKTSPWSHRQYFEHWVSDIWENILMRPRDNPLLEKITIDCDVVEWDILLLMLERRNFLNDPRVSPIKILVFRHELPYRLLYPLSELLGGRFVEHDSNHSFSLDAISKRVWNEAITGCMACHFSFRECKSLPNSRTLRYADPTVESIEMGRKHRPPHECLDAEPPLPPGMALWLSGRRERRNAYVERYVEISRTLRRDLSCDATSPRYEESVITGDTLAGANFGDNSQE